MKILNNAIKKAQILCNKNVIFYILLSFNLLFVVINIYKQNILFGLLFTIVNIIFLIFSDSKKSLALIFFLYPLSRVLKFPNIGTSILTILLLVFYLTQIYKFLIKKEPLRNCDFAVLILFFFYAGLTMIVSFINRNGFEINRLLSYYLYLTFPVVCFITIRKTCDIDMNFCLLVLFGSYLFGVLVTILFYKLIPGGQEMLRNIGVNVLDMGMAGVRYSPLTDDPNYGTALLILLSALFLCISKNRTVKIVGYSLIVVASIFSVLSISKMFILCLFITIVFIGISILTKIKNHFITLSTIVLFFAAILIFLSTPVGNSLLIRTIGTRDGISLNRITSGRTELFGEYTKYIITNPSVFLFGKGPVFSDLSYFTSGEHNTFTCTIFGSGVIPTTLFLSILLIMLKNRIYVTKYMPKNWLFITFIVCMLVCFMSLGINPSTVFPIFVVAAQFSNFNVLNDESFKEISI